MLLPGLLQRVSASFAGRGGGGFLERERASQRSGIKASGGGFLNLRVPCL